MKQIALIMLGISDISGGGGAERFFSSFYDSYQKNIDKKFHLYFITDQNSFSKLKALGYFIDSSNVILLPSFSNNKINFLLWNLKIIPTLIKYKIDLIHIPLASYFYIPFLYVIGLFKSLRVKIVLNLTDCTISHNYFTSNPDDSTKQLGVHKAYFKYLKIDGIYSWYKHFKEVFEKRNGIFKIKPLIEATSCCFIDLTSCVPQEKENTIIYAGRLIKHKQPMMFLKAINQINKYEQEILKSWQVKVFGKGILESNLKQYIKENNLENIVELTHSSKMNDEFVKSKIFVSTQDLENFTSLSMLEAMACGNVIISRNVGQTDYFVKNGINGFLLEEDSLECLASKITFYIKNEQEYKYMSSESINIAKNVHTVENFTLDIELFWEKVLKNV